MEVIVSGLAAIRKTAGMEFSEVDLGMATPYEDLLASFIVTATP